MSSDDLVNDDELEQMMQGFAEHFWSSRVPEFLSLWLPLRHQSLPEQGAFGIELKRAIHGLAGTAAMINEQDIGDLARRAETHWNNNGPAAEPTLAAIAALTELIEQRAAQR